MPMEDRTLPLVNDVALRPSDVSEHEEPVLTLQLRTKEGKVYLLSLTELAAMKLARLLSQPLHEE